MKKMPEDQFRLLYKRLTEELSQSEIIDFENWLKDSPENELLYRRMRDAWELHDYTPRIKGQKGAFERISKLLDFEEEISLERPSRKSTGTWNSWYKVAAVIILFISLAGILYFNTSTGQKTVQAEQINSVVKSNPAGQKTRIQLADGSVCWLNSESEIRYLENFSQNARDIYLTGEAYFEVAKNPDKPFRVHTSTMTITALGTIFNVTSFPGESTETVALLEGRIEVKCPNELFPEVFPGESVQIEKSTMLSSKQPIDVGNFMAWKNGELILEGLSFETILAKLERWYGVKIKVTGNPPDDLIYQARFKNQSLENVLESMKYGREWQYSLDGKHVEIMFN